MKKWDEKWDWLDAQGEQVTGRVSQAWERWFRGAHMFTMSPFLCILFWVFLHAVSRLSLPFSLSFHSVSSSVFLCCLEISSPAASIYFQRHIFSLFVLLHFVTASLCKAERCEYRGVKEKVPCGFSWELLIGLWSANLWPPAFQGDVFPFTHVWLLPQVFIRPCQQYDIQLFGSFITLNGEGVLFLLLLPLDEWRE